MNSIENEAKSETTKMVIKRSGERQNLSIEKMRTRLENLLSGLTKLINLDLIVNKVAKYAQNGKCFVFFLNKLVILDIKTTELDNLIAETAAYLNILHPDYGKLAARISVTKLHKETDDSFMEVINKLYFYTDSTGKTS